MKICSFGSLNMDNVYSVEDFVKKGETISSSSLNFICGGKGLNQSVALSKAGSNVYHAGNVGDDGAGESLLEMLKSSNVNSDYTVIKHGIPSGHAIIQVNKNSGDNCILLYGGANQTVSQKQIDNTLAGFKKGDILVLQNEINMLNSLISNAHEKGLIIAFNPSPMEEKLKNLPLEMIDILFMNEIEVEELTGKKPAEAKEVLQKKYPNTMHVITLGADGSEVLYKGESYKLGAQKVKVVDTTAAGDTFTGYFLTAYSEGKTIPECQELATKASALCIQKAGASVSIPMRSEVEA